MLLGSLRVPLLSGEITDETASAWVDCSGWQNIVIYVSGVDTTSSGVITIEEADIAPNELAVGVVGTPSVITTVNASDVTGGLQKAIHISSAAFGFVRTRISTVIGGGGSISTVLRAS